MAHALSVVAVRKKLQCQSLLKMYELPQEKLTLSLLKNTLEDALIKPFEWFVERYVRYSNENEAVNVDISPQPTDSAITIESFFLYVEVKHT